jgi:hypothetical protein
MKPDSKISLTHVQASKRNYWKTQCTISSRRHRTDIFECRLFKNRNDKHKGYYDKFIFDQQNFKNPVLYASKQKIIYMLGHKFDGVDYEEEMLYSMACNSKLFGTAMFRYMEKQW